MINKVTKQMQLCQLQRENGSLHRIMLSMRKSIYLIFAICAEELLAAPHSLANNRVIPIWNSLPNHAVSAETVNIIFTY